MAVHYYKNKDNLRPHYFFMEFNEGMKEQRYARIANLIITARKLIFVGWLLGFEKDMFNVETKILVMCALQMMYFAYMLK